jgi:MFS family permease
VRRLLILCSTLALFDITFYSAIAPLLPEYASDLGLGTAGAGVLSAAYAAGTLIASLPAGLLASRAGPRRTVIAGLVLLALASLVFGFAHQVMLLDAARFTQGCAGALIWSGALTWLITSYPPEKRGAVIGTALGTAVIGSLIGPAIGALAVEIGTEAVFGAVVIISAAFIVVSLRFPEPVAVRQRQSLAEISATALSRPVLTATAFVAIPSVMFGAIEVLAPLRIDDLGGAEVLIAAAFIGSAAVEGVVSPLAGRYSDRNGRRGLFVAGLALSGLALLTFAAAGTIGVVVAALLISALGAGACFTPALSMLSEEAEGQRLHQGFAAGISNMAWAAGQVLGGVGGGALAGFGGYALPGVIFAALMLATATYASRCQLRDPEPQATPG